MRRRFRRCAGVLAAALLTACGGSEQVQTFTASRVIAFGDEASVINADGSKYTVNALVAGSSALDCAAHPLWIQSVAGLYGLTFPQCPGSAANPVSRIRAVNGARVADLAGQIDTQLASGGLADGDLVTVFIGANDVVAQFARHPAVGEAQLLASVDAAGIELAAQVNRLAGLGVKVLASTVPDIGLTPFAGARTAGSTHADAALLSRLSERFNDAMLTRLLNDGRKIGLIQIDQYLQAVAGQTSVTVNSFSNTTQAACTVALPRCTTATLASGATATTWLWADDRHLSAGGQASLGSLAVTRAQNNPF